MAGKGGLSGDEQPDSPPLSRSDERFRLKLFLAGILLLGVTLWR